MSWEDEGEMKKKKTECNLPHLFKLFSSSYVEIFPRINLENCNDIKEFFMVSNTEMGK